jgi:succinate dehydrogenase flavin-adding protein (antitoxin of CptAB toxin-antitoxin module)
MTKSQKTKQRFKERRPGIRDLENIISEFKNTAARSAG